jgi:Na+-transporting NADH:ubiquinone oxidoreductase subunit A
MIAIKVKKGYDFKNIAGQPALEAEKPGKPACVAALPEKIPFIKPRLRVEVGDSVKIGSVLFEDRRNPAVRFMSPGGGEIAQINFGPRRIIKEIVIRLAENEAQAEFDALSEKALEQIERDKLVAMLLDGGMWPLIKAFPFRDIADPAAVPPAIFVSLGAKEAFQPAPEVYLNGKKNLFGYGIKILQKLTQNVYAGAAADNPNVLKELRENITHVFKGAYPADDPGVLLYHIKQSSSENRSWYIAGQDVLLLAQFLMTGAYPVERTVAVGGTSAPKKKHFITRIGVPLAHLAPGVNGDVRFTAGGILRGYAASKDGYLGLYETSVTLLPESGEKELFGFARPGFEKPSYSRAFLSFFNTSALPANCNLHGDGRACINCGACAEVCPVDILPQFAFKCVLADEVEESLQHGLLDCVECGLCSYVCPSKVEVCTILKKAKAAYYKETGVK